MALDPNVFNNQHTYQDYARAEEEFQQRKLAAQIDAQSKQLGLLGQIVGNNSVDQGTYDQARAYAQKNGIDTSVLPNEFNPDVVNRLRYAGATPTAQLSAMLQQQQMALKAGTATGDVTGFGYGGMNKPAASPTSSLAQNNVTPQNNPTPDNFDALFTPQPADVQAAADAKYGTPKTTILAKQPYQTVAGYKTAIETNPDAQAMLEGAKSKAKKEGEQQATLSEQANASEQTFGRLNQNLDALKELNQSLPEYGGILPVSTKAKAGLIAGDYGDNGKGYDALSKWDTVNQQQVVNALSELVKGGQIRGNQFIEKIINRGYAIDPNAPKATRDAEIEILRNELNNSAIQAQNINSKQSGGDTQPYKPTLPDKFQSDFADKKAQTIASPEEIAAFKQKHGIK